MKDLGERALIERLKLRYSSHVRGIGDDCAVVATIGSNCVVATTDPAPRPVAWDLGFDDYYYWGWLLVAINLSDINAAGAAPSGFLSSLTLPPELSIENFDRLLAGIDDACEAAGTEVIGGNLKEDPSGRVTCEGTAFGLVDGSPLSRSGGVPGHFLVALGPTGYFWAALQLLESSGSCDPDLRGHFLTPMPLAPLGAKLRRKGLLDAACDASDGLYAAVSSLTTHQGLGALLQPAAWQLPEPVLAAATVVGVPPWRLALGFGDLQMVCAVSPNNLSTVETIADRSGVYSCVLGRITADSGVRAVDESGRTGLMANFDNERFTSASQFTQGLAGYEQVVLRQAMI